MGSHWTDKEWMVDVIRHYNDGHTFGGDDMRERIIEALTQNLDVFPDWAIAIDLIKELPND